MPVVRLPIPGLTGGVSRQPATLRREQQVEHADNAVMTLTRGCEKRTGTEFIEAEGYLGELDAAGPTSTKFASHWIDRDSERRYLVLIDDSQVLDEDVVQIFDLDGNRIPVSFIETEGTSPLEYLKAGSPDSKDKLVLMTVADTTFIVNKEVVTALTGEQVVYTYSGTSVNDSDNAHHKDDWTAFDRPPAASGDYWYAANDTVGHPSGFYLSQNHSGVMPWYRRVRTEGADSLVDITTMPLRMDFDTGDNTFKIRHIAWNPRLSGDSDTNPGPSFIGKKLVDISFHRDRLFFAAEEQVVSSQAGDYFNLWLNNYATVTDADPIDVALSGNAVNIIQYLAGFAKSLTIFGAGAKQFELRSQGALTPSSVDLVPSTSYKSVGYCRPVTLGNQLYFASEGGGHSQVFEYFYDIDNASNVGVDVTSHVSGYVPLSLGKFSVSENNDLLIMGCSAEPSNLYIYQVYWIGSEKQQSAWYRWTFDEDNEIVSHHVFDNYLYILFRRASLLWMERVYLAAPIPDRDEGGTMPFNIKLDRRFAIDGVYDSGSLSTHFTLPFKDDSIDAVVLGGGWGNNKGRRFVPANNSDGTQTILSIPGDWSAEPVWVGRSYTMVVQLSEQVVRDPYNKTVIEGSLQLRQMVIRHKETGFYEVHVTPLGRQKQIHRFTAQRLGGLSTLLGRIHVDQEGEFICKPLCAAATSIIEIVNDSPVPCNITNILFIAGFVPDRLSTAR